MTSRRVYASRVCTCSSYFQRMCGLFIPCSMPHSLYSALPVRPSSRCSAQRACLTRFRHSMCVAKATPSYASAALNATWLQVDLARALMEDFRFKEVVWTDTDVVWLRDPLPFLAAHPTADIAIQTDCLSHAVEANFTAPFQHGFARCGHLPGNTFNNAFNTGMLLLRDRPATHAFLKAWLECAAAIGRL